MNLASVPIPNHMKKSVWRALAAEDGQDLVEYSLLLGFIALAAAGILTAASRNITTLWQDTSNALSAAAGAAS